MPGVSAHVSRFPVTEIGLSQAALGQFETGRMLAAAELLADARVASIVWNGTSAAWLGFAADEALSEAILARTAIPASTAVLAFRDLFRSRGIRRVGLVTPYTADVQARILRNWGEAGFDCAAERHLGLSENFAFAEVAGETIAGMVRAVAAEGAEAAAIVCTNLAGAELAAVLERETGIPVYDSVSVALWQGLRLAGCDPAPLAGWGSLFAGERLSDAA